MNEEVDIKIAEAYCLNELDAPAREALEERAKTDPEFRQLLEDTRILLAGLRSQGRMELREEIRRWDDKHRVRVVAWKSWTAIGVAAALVIAAGIFFFQPQTGTGSLALFREFYEPYPNVVMPSVRGSETDSTDLARAYDAYNRQEFAVAAEQFSKLEHKDDAVHFYLGQCYLAAGESDRAIEAFGQDLRDENVFRNQSEWFLALSYLQKGDQAGCEDRLRSIVGRGGPYKGKAESLLARLP